MSVFWRGKFTDPFIWWSFPKPDLRNMGGRTFAPLHHEPIFWRWSLQKITRPPGKCLKNAGILWPQLEKATLFFRFWPRHRWNRTKPWNLLYTYTWPPPKDLPILFFYWYLRGFTAILGIPPMLFEKVFVWNQTLLLQKKCVPYMYQFSFLSYWKKQYPS